MSFDAWLSLFAVAVLALLVAALALSVRAKMRRARRAAPLLLSIEASKAQLEQLRSRLAAGEITQQQHDEEEQRLMSGLLETASTAPAVSLQRSYLLKRPVALAGLVLAALAAGALYWVIDRPPATPGASTPPVAEAATQRPALSDEQLQRMVEQATAQVQKDPNDAAAWAMLAHSYDMLGKFAESSKAYAKLAPLVPGDAQVLADYADALAVANGRKLEGEPMALVKKALAIDGNNLKALALAGTAAFERKDYVEAVGYWKQARAASTDAAFKQQIEDSIAEARAAARGELAGAPDTTATATATASAPAGATLANAVVSGRVTLADDLLAKASPDATVFIFARPAKGSRMPVALLRKHVRDLPVDFTLDDSMSMVPDVKLSQVAMVVIVARVSKRGDVMSQPGDMQGWSAPVHVGTKGIKLEISEVLK